MLLNFSDGSVTNWNSSADDQDSNYLNDDQTQTTWHYRRIDLSSFAGKTLIKVDLVSESDTAAGNWDIYYDDISITSADGTVRPIYSRGTSVSLTAYPASGVTNAGSDINRLSNRPPISTRIRSAQAG